MTAEFVTLRDGSSQGCQLTSPETHWNFGSVKALVDIDESFLIEPNEGALRAPVDERTGMPLPIAPRSDLNSVPAGLVNDHHAYHPRLSPALRTRGGIAIRNSRIQRVHRTQHNHGPRSFHAIFQEGPIVPCEESEQIGLCGLGVAGYIPDRVVDTRQGEPRVRSIKEWEFRRLREPGELLPPLPRQVKKFRDKWLPEATLTDAKNKLLSNRERQASLGYRHVQYGLDPIRSFITSFVLEQDLSEVKSSLRRDFLLRHDIQAGLTLLGIASVIASRKSNVNGIPFNEVYDDLYIEGRLHPKMKPGAANLLMYKMGSAAGRVALLPRLRMAMLGLDEQVA